MKKMIVVALLILSFTAPARASLFGEEDVILTQILQNAITQLARLGEVVGVGKDTLGLLQDINRGINDSMSLYSTVFPFTDPGIYSDWARLQSSLGSLQSIYGLIVPSPDAKAQEDTDKEVVEALKLNSSIYDYSKNIDQIGEEVKRYSHQVSPGGAQKLTAQTLGVMLHVMNQSLRAQGTSLKLQAQTLALDNKKEKERTKQILAASTDLENAMKAQKTKLLLPRVSDLSTMGWLATQARQIHDIFYGLFFVLLGLFLTLAICLEYFKWPLGGTPSFMPFVGRALVAAILLYSYPDICDMISGVVDSLTQRLGSLNQFDLVLKSLSVKLHEMTWSLLSLRDIVIWLISFVTFFLLYVCVHAISSFLLFTWTILFIFSPLLICLFVFPSTANVTKGLYRALIEVSLWKVTWSVLATLLWSFALSKVNEPSHQIGFIAVIFLNLILAGSILMVPNVVHALAGNGFTSLAAAGQGLVAGAAMGGALNFPRNMIGVGKSGISRTAAVGGFVGGVAAAPIVGGRAFSNFIGKRFSKSTPRSSSGPTPPSWHKDIPFPTEPPPSLQAKLDREKFSAK